MPAQMHKQIRVSHPRGDFVIEIPDGAEITFGYFNPVSSEANRYGHSPGPGADTIKTSALRIYTGTGKEKRQIAVFLGVTGYRDLSIPYQLVVKKVVVQTSMEDDGLGGFDLSQKRTTRTMAMLDSGAYGDGEGDDDVVF